jgi:hypothetical protein
MQANTLLIITRQHQQRAYHPTVCGSAAANDCGPTPIALAFPNDYFTTISSKTDEQLMSHNATATAGPPDGSAAALATNGQILVCT